MSAEVVAEKSKDLAELEAQLGSLYAQIAQKHGLAMAMQALGRLMLATPPVPPPAPGTLSQPPSLTSLPEHTTLPAPPVSTSTATGALTSPSAIPPARSKASEGRMPSFAQFTLSPFSAAAGATTPPAASTPSTQPPASPPSSVSPPSGGATAGGGPGKPSFSLPILIPPAPQLASGPGLAHSRTMESVRTVPSPSLSQLPSGVLSIVSPSAADAGSEAADGDEGATDSSELGQALTPHSAAAPAARADGAAAVDAAAAAVAAAGGTRVSSGGGALAESGGVAGGGLAEASQAAADAVAAVVAAKAAAVAATVAAGGDLSGVDLAGSVRSTGTRGTRHSGSLWLKAINLSKAAADPWASRSLHTLAMERAVRQRYNAMSGHWVTDEVLVKMEAKPFAAGAMRECYAAKKLSTFTHSVDWHKAQNVVAKRYKKEGVRRAVYYNDVLVQMDAKMLGEMYNKTDPPKQVDVMQACILQFPGRPHKPVYAMEQLIEGDYVKYNSNSGFVKGDDLLRNTPQAFSHFTWALTKGLKICVDIQGVGDLYTDPQLHTLDGEGYGEGNLGLRGMALFFRSHECNALCCRLGLKPFERCDVDVRSQGYTSDTSSASASASASRPGATKAGATAARTLSRTTSYKARMAERRRRAEQQQPVRLSEEELLAVLKDVPKDHPEALVHLEVSKLYSEVVLLPELKPNEDPEDALRGALFHLTCSATCGSLLALTILARAHCGLEPSAPQFSHLIKTGVRQKLFKPHLRVAWRCTLLAAERGVRGAALAAAAAFATGTGLFGEEVLGGTAEPAQAVRWYSAALALPDLLGLGEGAEEEAGQRGGGGGVIHEGDEEGEDEEGEEEEGEEGLPGERPGQEESEDDPTQFEMSVMREDDGPEHVSGLSDLELSSGPALADLRVPKLEELRPSRAFLSRLKRTVEEEAASLPGASPAKYEILFQYGSVLLAGGPCLPPNPARAAELLEQAAEEAGAAGKGKLAQKYYEVAARAQAQCAD